MPYQVTNIRKKPNVDINFFIFPMEIHEKLTELNDQHTLYWNNLSNGLEEIIRRVFVDESAYQEFKTAMTSNELIQAAFAEREAYDTTVNIVSSVDFEVI